LIGRYQQISGKIFNPGNAQQAHSQVKLGNDVLDDLANTIGWARPRLGLYLPWLSSRPLRVSKTPQRSEI
jgi:hypothetical protein